MDLFLKREKIDSKCTELKKKSVPTHWVEKYRPRSINDVVYQTEVVTVLEQSLQRGDLPNMLFYGPPGTGKTSTILAVAKQLFGSLSENRILELNASDERGIQVIREKVKNFAQFSATEVQLEDRICPSFKIIILDEADSMTSAAQHALRRTMEKESKSTRFCLICNYVSRIIGPLTSRCMKFRFKPLNDETLMERLKFISESENVKCSDKVLKIIIDACAGDLRKAITCLQSCANLVSENEEINELDVNEMAGVIPADYLERFCDICTKKNLTELQVFVNDFILEAYSITQFFDQFNTWLMSTNRLNSEQRQKIGIKLGLCSYRLVDGGSDYIQLMDLANSIILAH